MRPVAELSRESLIKIVEALQGHLYLDLADSQGQDGIAPHSEFWNSDKPWSIDLLESLADKLRQHDLVPTEIEPLETEATDGPDEPTVHCDWSGYWRAQLGKEASSGAR